MITSLRTTTTLTSTSTVPAASSIVGFRSYADLTRKFGAVRTVAPGTWVATLPDGRKQLFIDRRFVPQNLRALYESAIGPLAPGYEPRPPIPPNPEPEISELVVIAIIAVLIGLLLPAVQKVRDSSIGSPVGVLSVTRASTALRL